MLVYEHPLSSYAQKVKIALREKGVAFDLAGCGNLAFHSSGCEFQAPQKCLRLINV
jgi:hypothetical protein